MHQAISLAGKRVLFVAPRFFGYDLDIADEIARRGAEVVRLFDRPFDSPLMTAVTKVAPAAIARAARPRYIRAVEDAGTAFDIVFVVNGQTLSVPFLDFLRRQNPGAKFILYLWDSLSNRGSIVPQLGRYDHVFGFDRTDAVEFGYTYRPLFFSRVFEASADAPPAGAAVDRYDISFIGTAHSDRAPIVRAIDQNLPADIRRFWFLFLQAPWVRRYYALRDPAFRRVPETMFRYQSLSKAAIGDVFRQSRTILDIEHPLQRGLTMRTFETLGANKKLVTTNPHVVEEPFFNPQNVLVVDRQSVSVSRAFLDQPYVPVPDAVYRRYALAGWLDEILHATGVTSTA